MAQGKTMWEGITGIIKFFIFGPPLIVMGLLVLMFPESIFNNFGVWLVVFAILTIIYWVLLGMAISSMINKRKQAKHQRELELARAKGKAFRGEEDSEWY